MMEDRKSLMDEAKQLEVAYSSTRNEEERKAYKKRYNEIRLALKSFENSDSASDNDTAVQQDSQSEEAEKQEKSKGLGRIAVIIIRIAWSISIGLIFFFLGTILYIIFDISYPQKEYGAKILTRFYEVGSLARLSRLKLDIKLSLDVEGSDLETVVTKQKRQQ